MQQVWQDYRGRNFQALALDVWNGSAGAVQSYADLTGSTFPVLRNAGYLTTVYGERHNYIVVDPEGVVRYTSGGARYGGFHNTAVRAAIDANLPVAIESPSWGGVKSLYR